jgi:hypothetical protein
MATAVADAVSSESSIARASWTKDSTSALVKAMCDRAARYQRKEGLHMLWQEVLDELRAVALVTVTKTQAATKWKELYNRFRDIQNGVITGPQSTSFPYYTAIARAFGNNPAANAQQLSRGLNSLPPQLSLNSIALSQSRVPAPDVVAEDELSAAASSAAVPRAVPFAGAADGEEEPPVAAPAHDEEAVSAAPPVRSSSSSRSSTPTPPRRSRRASMGEQLLLHLTRAEEKDEEWRQALAQNNAVIAEALRQTASTLALVMQMLQQQQRPAPN